LGLKYSADRCYLWSDIENG